MRNESTDEPIHIRIGLQTGEAIEEADAQTGQDDFFGKNKIMVSSLLKELTESAVGLTFGEGREVELMGLAGPHHVFDILWE